MVSHMGLPMALRRWLPAVLLLAALGCAVAVTQPAQSASQPASGHVIGDVPEAAGGAVGQREFIAAAHGDIIGLSSAQAAEPADAAPMGGNALAPLFTPVSAGAGCGDHVQAAAPPEHPASPPTDADFSTGAPIETGGAPPAGALAHRGPDGSAAPPVGLLLADVSMLRL